MEKNPKIKVIIPVYNCQDFIGDCLDSLINQTYTNWEAYCIDDGSNDSSGRILDSYSQKSRNIKVFHKPNGGVCTARNFALDQIDNAHNSWVSFVDADDYLSPYMFEDIVSAINNENKREIEYVRLFPKVTNVRYRDRTEIFSRAMNGRVVSTNEYFKKEDVGGYIASLFVKAEIIKKNGIHFVESMKFLEDQVFSITCAVHSSNILILPGNNYFYYSNPNSSSRLFLDRSNDIIKCINNVKRIIDQTGDIDLHCYFKERYMPTKMRMLIKERLKHLFSKSKVKIDFNITFSEYSIPVVDRMIWFLLRLFDRL